MLTTLAYASNALVPAHSAEMLDIARAALRNNKRLGVTGALFFDGKQFYQVLEGEDTVIACLFDNIRADRRHTDVQLVYYRSIPERRFGDWSMKFVDGTRRGDLAPIFDYRAAVHPGSSAQDTRIEALLAA
jgi:hypothetical protein